MRGDIYRYRPDGKQGHEQDGARYAVIVQHPDLTLSTALIVPTSTSVRDARFRVPVEIDGTRTLLLAEQTTAVDTRRLGNFAGRLDPAELAALDEALRLVLDLH